MAEGGWLGTVVKVHHHIAGVRCCRATGCLARHTWAYVHNQLQESGRAGRDGRISHCILYYTYADAAKSRHMLKQSAQETGTPPQQVGRRAGWGVWKGSGAGGAWDGQSRGGGVVCQGG